MTLPDGWTCTFRHELDDRRNIVAAAVELRDHLYDLRLVHVAAVGPFDDLESLEARLYALAASQAAELAWRQLSLFD